ncbi:ExbD/TolR family protein [Methylobacter sp.]|uniref:ExbD/TolR family protein n=1 Tax=Methylobacter sp. TaxID=2051955 RepID=UPI002FDF038B
MRNKSRRSSRWTNQPDINLNAFLDLVLNILLFFVFATELAVFEAIDVSVPITEYSDTLSRQRQALIIFITKDNQYLADGEKMPIANLAGWLSQKKQSDDTLNTVIVRGDLNSSLQATVDVLGACRMAGIEKVKIETEKPST